MSVQGAIKEKTRINIQEPKNYKVIMYNDDFTTMDFVVEILVDIFHKDEAEAERLMLLVHHCGKAVVGVYPYDIAITMVKISKKRARQEGFPFRMAVEEV